MTKKPIIVLLTMTYLTACATVTDSFQGVLSDNPAVSGGSYSSGGGLTVAADLREHQGYTAVCGVWAQSKRQSILTRTAAHQVIPSGAVYLGDEAIVRGLNFMPEVAPTGRYGGAKAGCAASDRPWKAGDETREITIRLPRQTVYHDIDGTSGGEIVYFRQTGPGAERNGLSASDSLKDVLNE